MKNAKITDTHIQQSNVKQQYPQQTEIELTTLRESLSIEMTHRNRLQNELAAVEKIATFASVAESEDALLEHVTQYIGKTFYPDSFGLLLVDQKNNLIRPHHSYHGAKSSLLLSQGITGEVIRTGHARNVPDVSEESAFLSVDPATKSELCVPIKIGSQVIGVINAESERPSAFSDSDERLLTIIAHQLAVSIEKIRLANQVSQSLQREQMLTRISRAIGQAQDLPTLLADVIRLTARLIGADAGRLGLIIDDQIIIYYPYSIPHTFNLRPSPKGRGTAWHIIESEQSILLADYQKHPKAQHAWVKSGINAYLGIPIISGNDYLGTLELICWGPDSQFRQEDVPLVEMVGRQAGTAIQNNRLYTELQERASILATVLSKREELDQMKNRFIQDVSHELRTPSGIILGYAELLEIGNLGSMEPQQRQAVQIMAGRARMLNELIDELSTMLAAETQDFRQEEVDLKALIAVIALEFKVQAEEADILLFSEIKDDLPVIMGHPVHLRRVFDNLIGNAFKFTAAGGTISMNAWPEGNEVVVEVADTGVGIAEKKLDRIFERFYKVDTPEARRKKGTGLGLSLVKEIVTAHDGTVSVRSQVEVGTTFQIRLPAKS